MIQLAYFLLIFVLIIDLLFYVPLKIHFFIDSSSIYLYLFTFKIIYKDDFKDFNLLKDKITINKIKESDKEDIKIIKSFKIKKLHTSIDKKLSFLNFRHKKVRTRAENIFFNIPYWRGGIMLSYIDLSSKSHLFVIAESIFVMLIAVFVGNLADAEFAGVAVDNVFYLDFGFVVYDFALYDVLTL